MTTRQPWFPFYVTDFMLDPAMLALPDEQLGIHLRMLAWSWWSDALPTDDEARATVLHRPVTALTPHLAALWQVDGFRLQNPNLEALRRGADELREARSRGGKIRQETRHQRRPRNGKKSAQADLQLSSSTPPSSPGAKHSTAQHSAGSTRAALALPEAAPLRVPSGEEPPNSGLPGGPDSPEWRQAKAAVAPPWADRTTPPEAA